MIKKVHSCRKVTDVDLVKMWHTRIEILHEKLNKGSRFSHKINKEIQVAVKRINNININK